MKEALISTGHLIVIHLFSLIMIVKMMTIDLKSIHRHWTIQVARLCAVSWWVLMFDHLLEHDAAKVDRVFQLLLTAIGLFFIWLSLEQIKKVIP